MSRIASEFRLVVAYSGRPTAVGCGLSLRRFMVSICRTVTSNRNIMSGVEKVV